jgi:methionyl-tRNA formyltransferase
LLVRIIFFGEDSFSATVLNSVLKNGYEVVMIVSPLYDNFLYKRLELIAQKYSIPFFRERDINSSIFIDSVRESEPDLIITTHFQKLLKKELITLPDKGCLNLHPSLLPCYRGMSPQHWPIINGDAETGLTVHYIDEGVDSGNILIQKKIPIDPNTYVFDLQMQMLPHYGKVVVDAIKKIENGDAAGEKQDLTKGSFYGKFKKKNAEIQMDSKKTDALNLIRAISKPYMGAYFGNFILWKAHLIKEALELQLMNRFNDIGLHFEVDGSVFLKLEDGVLMVDSYEQIQAV